MYHIFKVLCFFVACASASPVWPLVNAVPYAGYPASFASKYHAQDELGQASFGFAYPGHAASNYRDALGNQVGSYAYINAEGKEVQVSYTADHRGFRVLSNDLPVAPVDESKAPVFEGKAPVFDGKAPEPVQDTPEVAAAKVEHFRLKEEAKAAAASAPEVASVTEEKPAVADVPVADVPVAETPVVEAAPVADAPVEAAPVADVPVADAPAAEVTPVFDAPVEVEAARKKRQVPFYPAALPYSTFPYGPAFYHGALPAVKHVAPWVAPVPLVAPTPLVAKTTVKTVTAEADLTAKTPADTNKFDLKEKSFDVVTPLAYPYHTPYAYTYPFAAPVAAPAAVESSRKKRQVPLLPYTSAFYGAALPVPLVAKTTVKSVTAEADLTAKTPSDTNKFDLKEKSFDVVTPLAYQTPFAYANAYPYYSGYYGYY